MAAAAACKASQKMQRGRAKRKECEASEWRSHAAVAVQTDPLTICTPSIPTDRSALLLSTAAGMVKARPAVQHMNCGDAGLDLPCSFSMPNHAPDVAKAHPRASVNVLLCVQGPWYVGANGRKQTRVSAAHRRSPGASAAHKAFRGAHAVHVPLTVHSFPDAAHALCGTHVAARATDTASANTTKHKLRSLDCLCISRASGAIHQGSVSAGEHLRLKQQWSPKSTQVLQ